MLKIAMDNGETYFFNTEDFTEYKISKRFLIVKKDDQWIGCFNIDHMVGFYIV